MSTAMSTKMNTKTMRMFLTGRFFPAAAVTLNAYTVVDVGAEVRLIEPVRGAGYRIGS